MGQQQSSEKGDKPEKTSRTPTSQTDKDKKVMRRPSVQMLTGRSSPADPSATTASATAQNLSQPGKSGLLGHLQAASPELSGKGRVERSTSRSSKASKKREDEKPEHMPASAVPSEPMNVPSATKSRPDTYDERTTFHTADYIPVSQMRPPRLPLPIDGVIPESPILKPVDEEAADHDQDAVPPLEAPRHAIVRDDSARSMLTEEEDEDHDELQPYAFDTSAEAVPTVIEWNRPYEGGKVYVTGSFASWRKKYRLFERKDKSGFSAVVSLPPGTHHLIFFAPGPQINPDMQTTVDLNNVLVNYLEVIPEVSVRGRRESNQKPLRPPGSSTPRLEEPEPEMSGAATPAEDEASEEPPEEEIPMGDFRQVYPRSLMDIDYAEEDARYNRAVQIIQETQAPPGLPMFLGKSILNGILPMKDDASVLTLPNHTVLNHLATSAVRSGVLATSVTTRYKKKVSVRHACSSALLTIRQYVTSIMYKPVPKVHHS